MLLCMLVHFWDAVRIGVSKFQGEVLKRVQDLGQGLNPSNPNF